MAEPAGRRAAGARDGDGLYLIWESGPGGRRVEVRLRPGWSLCDVCEWLAGLGWRLDLWLFCFLDPANAVRVGRLAGADIWVHRGWPLALLGLRAPLLAVFIHLLRPGWEPPPYALLGLAAALLSELVGLLPHELGHIVAARLCRRRVVGILLAGVVGFAYSERTAATVPRDRCVVALAGPLVTFLVANLWLLAARVLGPFDPDALTPAQALALALAVEEFLTGVLNLLPVGRLDGAQALRALRRG